MKITKKRAEVSEGLKALRQRLERWRRCKRGRREKIPDEFWQEAAKAAQVHGVSAVAVNLKLDYSRLREWAGVKKSGRAKRNLDAEPAFIEVCPPVPAAGLPNAIEIQRAGGSKVRLEFESSASRELLKLSEKLWKAAR